VSTEKLAPDDKAGREAEPFLSRWSRRKDESRREVEEQSAGKSPEPDTVALQLPALDKLTFESDYRGFLHPKVSEEMRRAALKKLFSDPHFNVMDGLDVYIDDYSKTEPIPAAMLASLRQAQKILESAREDNAQRAAQERQQPTATPAPELSAAGTEDNGASSPTSVSPDGVDVPSKP
jgi:hypothetical protein